MTLADLSLPGIGGPVAPLRSESLADQVADYIVEAIAKRKLVSGEKLIETELAEVLGVSRVPIREATRILASQGIVVPTPRRGMRVASFDFAWGAQLHNVRVAVERLAARDVAEKLKTEPEHLDVLIERADAIEREAEHPREDPFLMNKADIAFHAAVFEIAASPLLSTLWSAIARHVLIMFAIESYRHPDYNRISIEHGAYLDALKSGDPDLLDEEIERHVAGVRTYGSAPEVTT